ncbi:hypothetical protein HY061_00400 [Candidatus Azambacteria bacterium]|nr:hypothetical protein [Candidatus Azambacteria bacterium]
MEFKWRAPEFIEVEHSKAWFLNLGGVVVALILIFFVLKNYYAIFIALLSGFILSIMTFKKPKIVEVCLNSDSIKIDNLKVDFKDLINFSLRTEDNDLDELIFETKNFYPSKLNIILDPEINLEELRSSLLTLLPEKEYQETLSEFLARILKL